MDAPFMRTPSKNDCGNPFPVETDIEKGTSSAGVVVATAAADTQSTVGGISVNCNTTCKGAEPYVVIEALKSSHALGSVIVPLYICIPWVMR